MLLCGQTLTSDVERSCCERTHEQYVTAGHCNDCGAPTPVRVLSPAQLAANFQCWNDDPQLGATVRIEASAQLAEARRRWTAESPPGEQQRVG